VFRIRRIYDDVLPLDRQVLRQIRVILEQHFSLLSEEEKEKLPDLLKNPLKHGFRTILFVAEDGRHQVQGFAILYHFPDLRFCLLDFLSVQPEMLGRGVGGVLYERIREEVVALKAEGLFFECLPDDPAVCREEKLLPQNRARLKFYERYGARPIVGTCYEAPLSETDLCPPYLVYDPLDQEKPLRRNRARAIVRAILERKYGSKCPPEYTTMVVASITEDPVRIRAPRYPGKQAALPARKVPPDRKIGLWVNEKHEIHHIKERGYVEAPVRVRTILDELEKTELFERLPVKQHPERHILAVHDADFAAYLKKVCHRVGQGRPVYPYVFPLRNQARPPRELPVRAGYYCIDTFTPLNENAYLAARRAVDCALSGADEILKGRRLSYALVRPPGHHAERRAFGGFCYFNSAAVAAHLLSGVGRTAVLDIDYHHGNGTQTIFSDRSDVLTVSIHGHPRFAYPFFSGFKEEQGEGEGEGYNRNFPLQERVDGEMYRNVLDRALAVVREFDPDFLVVGLGLDTAKADPTGTWSLTGRDFFQNGRRIGQMRIPSLVVQEGGYLVRSLGRNARKFFEGLWEGHFGAGGF
jgi:acetoin utilization deacetylase AcuC-like enzyme/GNAT superfamily N-acetyltransferase